MPQRGRGTRDNLGLEGLALTPDARHAWLAMEGAADRRTARSPRVDAPGRPVPLHADRRWPTAAPCARSPTCPTPSRVRPLLPGGYADNGVSEVLMIDAAPHAGARARLRRGRRQLAAPLRDRHPRGQRHAGPGRARARQPPRRRRRRWWPTSPRSASRRLDNTEGMCWGPPLPERQAHAGGGERRQFQPAADHAVRRLRIHWIDHEHRSHLPAPPRTDPAAADRASSAAATWPAPSSAG